MSDKITCAAYNCSKEVPSDRKKKRYATCSNDCGRSHSINLMTIARGKREGKEVKTCTDCGKFFTDHKKVVPGQKRKEFTICYKCRGIFCGPKPVERKKYKYDQNAAGKTYKDFRQEICKPGGIDCDHYSECSDDYHGKGFKYLHNGKVNCYEHMGSVVNRVNFGHSIGVCSDNR